MLQLKGKIFKWIKGLLILLLIVITSACATWHRAYHGALMKGNIIETSDSKVYLCIGKRDGASVGQELNVYKVISTSLTPKLSTFKRELIGKIKIVEIDDHFAKAVVISGKAEKYNIVELIPPK